MLGKQWQRNQRKDKHRARCGMWVERLVTACYSLHYYAIYLHQNVLTNRHYISHRQCPSMWYILSVHCMTNVLFVMTDHRTKGHRTVLKVGYKLTNFFCVVEQIASGMLNNGKLGYGSKHSCCDFYIFIWSEIHHKPTHWKVIQSRGRTVWFIASKAVLWKEQNKTNLSMNVNWPYSLWPWCPIHEGCPIHAGNRNGDKYVCDNV